ncbi:MAG TPA: HRDC domain-containing protein, partial [Xanthobacteraceae bacterium]|nr:HRDC domain-containing protein [Xanthobacteraceae bacterium]
IFPDRTLIEMARAKPATLRDLARIHGIGTAKLERYGARFLDALRGHLTTPTGTWTARKNAIPL